MNEKLNQFQHKLLSFIRKIFNKNRALNPISEVNLLKGNGDTKRSHAIFSLIIIIVLVAVVAAIFIISNRLSQNVAVAPTAPESRPAAADRCNNKCTGNQTCVQKNGKYQCATPKEIKNYEEKQAVAKKKVLSENCASMGYEMKDGVCLPPNQSPSALTGSISTTAPTAVSVCLPGFYSGPYGGCFKVGTGEPCQDAAACGTVTEYSVVNGQATLKVGGIEVINKGNINQTNLDKVLKKSVEVPEDPQKIVLDGLKQGDVETIIALCIQQLKKSPEECLTNDVNLAKQIVGDILTQYPQSEIDKVLDQYYAQSKIAYDLKSGSNATFIAKCKAEALNAKDAQDCNVISTAKVAEVLPVQTTKSTEIAAKYEDSQKQQQIINDINKGNSSSLSKYCLQKFGLSGADRCATAINDDNAIGVIANGLLTNYSKDTVNSAIDSFQQAKVISELQTGQSSLLTKYCLQKFGLSGADRCATAINDFNGIKEIACSLLDNLPKEVVDNATDQYQKAKIISEVSVGQSTSLSKYCLEKFGPSGAERCIAATTDPNSLKELTLSLIPESKEIFRQQTISSTLNGYKNLSLGVATVDTKQIYQDTYDKCVKESSYGTYYGGLSSSADCERKAADAVNSAYNNQNNQIAINNREQQKLIASCKELGGGRQCDQSALAYLVSQSTDPNLSAQKIAGDRQLAEANLAEQMAEARMSATLANMGMVKDPKMSWVETEKKLTDLRASSFEINVVVGWNDFTSGRFYRGNQMLMEGLNETKTAQGWELAGAYGKYIGGSIIQGADAGAWTAAAVGAVIAAPIGVGASGFLGTGVGVATSVQMIGGATDTCSQVGTVPLEKKSAQQKACAQQVALAATSVLGTGLGVMQGSMQAVNAASVANAADARSALTYALGSKLIKVGAASIKTVEGVAEGAKTYTVVDKVMKGTELAIAAVNTVNFTSMIEDACSPQGKEGVNGLHCTSSVLMAVASGGKFLANAGQFVNLAQKLPENFVNVGENALRTTEITSQATFFTSACLGLANGINSDSLAMCGMGISGLSQTISAENKSAKIKEAKTRASELELAVKTAEGELSLLASVPDKFNVENVKNKALESNVRSTQKEFETALGKELARESGMTSNDPRREIRNASTERDNAQNRVSTLEKDYQAAIENKAPEARVSDLQKRLTEAQNRLESANKSLETAIAKNPELKAISDKLGQVRTEKAASDLVMESLSVEFKKYQTSSDILANAKVQNAKAQAELAKLAPQGITPLDEKQRQIEEATKKISQFDRQIRELEKNTGSPEINNRNLAEVEIIKNSAEYKQALSDRATAITEFNAIVDKNNPWIANKEAPKNLKIAELALADIYKKAELEKNDTGQVSKETINAIAEAQNKLVEAQGTVVASPNPITVMVKGLVSGVVNLPKNIINLVTFNVFNRPSTARTTAKVAVVEQSQVVESLNKTVTELEELRSLSKLTDAERVSQNSEVKYQELLKKYSTEVLSEAEKNEILLDPVKSSEQVSNILDGESARLNNLESEINVLKAAREKLALATELSLLNAISPTERTTEQASRFNELANQNDLFNFRGVKDEYIKSYDNLKEKALGNKQTGQSDWQSIQEAIQKTDVISEARMIADKIAIEKAKGTAANQTIIDTLNNSLSDILNKVAIKAPEEIPAIFRDQMISIIHESEHRAAIDENGARISRADQIDALFKLLGSSRAAVELTTNGGKTIVNANYLKINIELFGKETGIYVTKEGDIIGHTQSQLQTMTGEKVVILDSKQLNNPDYVKEILGTKYIVSGVTEINFIRDFAMDPSSTDYVVAKAVYEKLIKNSTAVFDEAQLTLDPNVSGIIQKGESYQSSASFTSAVGDVATALQRLELLNQNPKAYQELGALERSTVDTANGAEIAITRFTPEYYEKIYSVLKEIVGDGVVFDNIRNNSSELNRLLDSAKRGESASMALIAEKAGTNNLEMVERVLDQLSAVNTFAHGLTIEYGRSVDPTLQSGGESRYQESVTIPREKGVDSYGQTFSGDLNLVMEYVGAIQRGETPNPSGLKTNSNSAYSSNILSFLSELQRNPSNNVGAITGTLGGAKGIAETVLGLTPHTSSEAINKAIGANATDQNRLVNPKNGHAVRTFGDAITLISDFVKSKAIFGEGSNGSAKFVNATENTNPRDLVIGIEEARKNNGITEEATYFVQEGGKVYKEYRIGPEGELVVFSEKITTSEIQARYQRGEKNLITIIDRGGMTGDSIITPENVTFVPIINAGDAAYAVAQEIARGPRGNVTDVQTLAIIIDSAAPKLETTNSQSRIEAANANFDFTSWRNNLNTYEEMQVKNNITNANNQLVETHSKSVLEELSRSSDPNIAKWASDTLLKQFSTKESGRNLSTKDTAITSLERRNEIAREQVAIWEKVMSDPTNREILNRIKSNNSEAYQRMEANRDLFKNNPDGYQYATSPNTTINSDSYLVADSMAKGLQAHNQLMVESRENKYVASTKDNLQQIDLNTKQVASNSLKQTGTNQVVPSETPLAKSLAQLEVPRGYDAAGNFSLFRYVFNIKDPVQTELTKIKNDIKNGVIVNQAEAIERLNNLSTLTPDQKLAISQSKLITVLPEKSDNPDDAQPIVSTPQNPVNKPATTAIAKTKSKSPSNGAQQAVIAAAQNAIQTVVNAGPIVNLKPVVAVITQTAEAVKNATSQAKNALQSPEFIQAVNDIREAIGLNVRSVLDNTQSAVKKALSQPESPIPGLSRISDEEKKFFDIKRAHDAITADFLSNPKFAPAQKLIIEGVTYYFPEGIFRASNNYLQTPMYFIDPSGRVLTRMLYKSNSDGGWRSTPYSEPNGRYSKGNKYHYTQETKVHDAINNFLVYQESKNRVLSYRGDLISTKYIAGLVVQNGLLTFSNEVKLYNDRGTLNDFQSYMPGKFGSKDQNTGLPIPTPLKIKDFFYPDGFIPTDFSKPTEVYETNHTLLGHTVISKYPAVLNGRPIVWYMAVDDYGRVWVDRIVFAESKLTSYGVYNIVINSGILTSKPLDYSFQADALQEGRDFQVFNKKYYDITPLLNNLSPIQQFRKANNINRSAVANKNQLNIQKAAPQVTVAAPKPVSQPQQQRNTISQNMAIVWGRFVGSITNPFTDVVDSLKNIKLNQIINFQAINTNFDAIKNIFTALAKYQITIPKFTNFVIGNLTQLTANLSKSNVPATTIKTEPAKIVSPILRWAQLLDKIYIYTTNKNTPFYVKVFTYFTIDTVNATPVNNRVRYYLSRINPLGAFLIPYDIFRLILHTYVTGKIIDLPPSITTPPSSSPINLQNQIHKYYESIRNKIDKTWNRVTTVISDKAISIPKKAYLFVTGAIIIASLYLTQVATPLAISTQIALSTPQVARQTQTAIVQTQLPTATRTQLPTETKTQEPTATKVPKKLNVEPKVMGDGLLFADSYYTPLSDSDKLSVSGKFYTPKLIILHVDEGNGTLANTTNGLKEVGQRLTGNYDENGNLINESYVGRTKNTHFAVSRNGETLQYLPMDDNKIAESYGAYGYPQAISIEMGGKPAWFKGNQISSEQLNKTVDLVESLMVKYNLPFDQVFGHNEKSTFGKTDPGAEFMSIFKQELAYKLTADGYDLGQPTDAKQAMLPTATTLAPNPTQEETIASGKASNNLNYTDSQGKEIKINFLNPEVKGISENSASINNFIGASPWLMEYLPKEINIYKQSGGRDYSANRSADGSVRINLTTQTDSKLEEKALVAALAESTVYATHDNAVYGDVQTAYYNIFYLGKGGVPGKFSHYDPDTYFEENQVKVKSDKENPFAGVNEDYAKNLAEFIVNPEGLIASSPYRYNFFKLVSEGVNPLAISFVADGQKTESDNPIISELFASSEVANLTWDDLPEKIKKNNSEYRDIVEEVSQKTGVPVAIIVGVMQKESGSYNDRNGRVSEDGYASVGLMQVIPSDGPKPIGGRPTSAELVRPEINILTGAQILKSIYNNPSRGNGNWFDTIALYNAGSFETIFSDKIIDKGGYVYAKDIYGQLGMGEFGVVEEIPKENNTFGLKAAIPSIYQNQVNPEGIKTEMGKTWGTTRWLPIVDIDKPTAYQKHRSVNDIKSIISYHNVADPKNERYQSDGQNTFCNIYVSDIMTALGVSIPHWWNGVELTANATLDWLVGDGVDYGWKEITSAKEAQNLAVKGFPVVAVEKIPDRVGHIAVVIPGSGTTINGIFYPSISQAGGTNYAETTVNVGFEMVKPVRYFVNTGSPYGAESASILQSSPIAGALTLSTMFGKSLMMPIVNFINNIAAPLIVDPVMRNSLYIQFQTWTNNRVPVTKLIMNFLNDIYLEINNVFNFNQDQRDNSLNNNIISNNTKTTITKENILEKINEFAKDKAIVKDLDNFQTIFAERDLSDSILNFYKNKTIANEKLIRSTINEYVSSKSLGNKVNEETKKLANENFSYSQKNPDFKITSQYEWSVTGAPLDINGNKRRIILTDKQVSDYKSRITDLMSSVYTTNENITNIVQLIAALNKNIKIETDSVGKDQRRLINLLYISVYYPESEWGKLVSEFINNGGNQSEIPTLFIKLLLENESRYLWSQGFIDDTFSVYNQYYLPKFNEILNKYSYKSRSISPLDIVWIDQNEFRLCPSGFCMTATGIGNESSLHFAAKLSPFGYGALDVLPNFGNLPQNNVSSMPSQSRDEMLHVLLHEGIHAVTVNNIGHESINMNGYAYYLNEDLTETLTNKIEQSIKVSEPQLFYGTVFDNYQSETIFTDTILAALDINKQEIEKFSINQDPIGYLQYQDNKYQRLSDAEYISFINKLYQWDGKAKILGQKQRDYLLINRAPSIIDIRDVYYHLLNSQAQVEENNWLPTDFYSNTSESWWIKEDTTKIESKIILEKIKNGGLPIGYKMVNQFAELLKKRSEFYKINEGRTYPLKDIIKMNSKAVEKIFLQQVVTSNPEAIYSIDIYNSTINSNQQLNPGQGQVIINNIIANETKAFMDDAGNAVSLEGYLQSIYNSRVKLIRTEVTPLDAETKLLVLDGLKSRIDKSVSIDGKEMSYLVNKNFPISKILIEKDDMVETIPIILAPLDRNVRGMSAQIDSIDGKKKTVLYINTKNITTDESLIGVFDVIVHEVDHGVYSTGIKNDSTLTNELDAIDFESQYTNVLLENGFNSNQIDYLIEKIRLKNKIKINDLKIIPLELSAEGASIRMIDNLAKGYKKLLINQGNNDYAEVINDSFKLYIQTKLLLRQYEIVAKSVQMYSVVYNLATMIGKEYGFEQVLKMVFDQDVNNWNKELTPLFNEVKKQLFAWSDTPSLILEKLFYSDDSEIDLTKIVINEKVNLVDTYLIELKQNNSQGMILLENFLKNRFDYVSATTLKSEIEGLIVILTNDAFINTEVKNNINWKNNFDQISKEYSNKLEIIADILGIDLLSGKDWEGIKSMVLHIAMEEIDLKLQSQNTNSVLLKVEGENNCSSCSIRTNTVNKIINYVDNLIFQNKTNGALNQLATLRNYINSHQYVNVLVQYLQNANLESAELSLLKNSAEKEDALLAIQLTLEKVDSLISSRTDLTPEQRSALDTFKQELLSQQNTITNIQVRQANLFENLRPRIQRAQSSIRRYTGQFNLNARLKEDLKLENTTDLTRWSTGIIFGAALTKSALAITNLSFTKDAFPNFINQLSQFIGPLATSNPNFWRWQLIDYAFGVITAGLGYLTINLLIGKFLPSFKFKTQAAVAFAVFTTLLASVAGELYGSITAFKGSPIDLADWFAEMGGMATFLSAEWIYSQIAKRGLSLSQLIFKNENLLPTSVRQLMEKILIYISLGGVLIVLYYSFLYLFKLFGFV